MALIGISGKIGSGKDTIATIIQYLTLDRKSDIATSRTIFEFIKDSESIGNIYATDNSSVKWDRKKFAGKLKQCIALILGIPVEDLEKEEVKNRILDEEWHRYFNWHYKLQTNDNPKGKISKYSATIDDANEDFYLLNETISGHQVKLETLTIRQLLQEFGTEVGRSIHPNFWVNALFADYGIKDLNYFKAYPDNYNLPNWIISDVRFPNEAEAIKSRGGIVIRINRSAVFAPANGRGVKAHVEARLHSSETALDNYQFDEVIENEGTIEELIVKVKEILIKHKLL